LTAPALENMYQIQPEIGLACWNNFKISAS
jgi:hypothetical protein